MSDIAHDFITATEADIEKQVRKVVSGSITTIEDYRAACGQIYAFRRAIDNFREAVKKTLEPEDREEVST